MGYKKYSDEFKRDVLAMVAGSIRHFEPTILVHAFTNDSFQHFTSLVGTH